MASSALPVGCGTLAKMVAPRAKKVLAIERDRDLVAALREETLPGNVELLEQDAAAFDYAGTAAAGQGCIIVRAQPVAT